MSAASPTTRAVGQSAPGRAWAEIAREVVADRTNRAVFLVTATMVAFAYSLLLPFAYTQRISFANWDYLDARYLGFSIAFALGLGWLITLQVHAVRRLARSADRQSASGRTGPLGALAAVASVLPSLLCCSPILPTLIGVLGLSATTRLDTTVQLQHFFATKENLILGGALVLLLCNGLWSMRKLSRAACLTDAGCASPMTGQEIQARPAAPRNGRVTPSVVVGARVDQTPEIER